uniref:Uncharacterized protein n=1 Tax=Anopheles melas TaxID=34690 RepID=A0A182UCI8_9DIPT
MPPPTPPPPVPSRPRHRPTIRGPTAQADASTPTSSSIKARSKKGHSGAREGWREHQHQQGRTRDGVDEQELAHTVYVHWQVVDERWGGRPFAEVGGEQVARPDDPAGEQRHDHER